MRTSTGPKGSLASDCLACTNVVHVTEGEGNGGWRQFAYRA